MTSRWEMETRSCNLREWSWGDGLPARRKGRSRCQDTTQMQAHWIEVNLMGPWAKMDPRSWGQNWPEGPWRWPMKGCVGHLAKRTLSSSTGMLGKTKSLPMGWAKSKSTLGRDRKSISRNRNQELFIPLIQKTVFVNSPNVPFVGHACK